MFCFFGFFLNSPPPPLETDVAKQVHVQINSQKQLFRSFCMAWFFIQTLSFTYFLTAVRIYIFILKKTKKLMCHIAHLRKHHNVDDEKTPIIFFMRIEWAPFILKTWIPFVHAKDAMFQLWLKLTLRFFKLRRCILRYFVITPPPPWKKL